MRLLLFLILFSLTPILFASEPTHSEATAVTSINIEAEKFAPGEFIMEHISDAYEWHITTLGKTHIYIPLPVILYQKEKGLNLFWSSHFHHGHKSYKGYKISSEEKYKGKIVCVDEQENIDEEATAKLCDFSIKKNVLAIFFSAILLIVIFISIANAYKKRPRHAPKGLQSLLEPVILFIRDDIGIPSIGKEKYEKYMPYLLTVFFFIFLNNLLGLIPIFPGGANVTGNIAIPMILAIITFLITTFSGNKNYWRHIFNAPSVPWWLKIPIPLMPFVELIGVFTKPFVLMVRLFANISAGHIIMMGFFSLIFIFGNMTPIAGYGASVLSLVFSVFMTFLELLVAFIQAYVFTLLSALYFGMATEEHH